MLTMHRHLVVEPPQEHATQKVIVYFLTCACVDWAAAALSRLPQARGLPPPRALHGRMKQAAREATLAAFADEPAGERRPSRIFSKN